MGAWGDRRARDRAWGKDDLLRLVFSCCHPSLETGESAALPGADDEGASFSLFGGHVTGRHVELVPSKRVVQAWRPKTWPEGQYSIVRFQLEHDGGGTKIVFDHDGFPADMAEHLAKGWQSNYWDKLSRA